MKKPMNIPLIIAGVLIGGIFIWAGITGFSLKEINFGMFKWGKENANSFVPQTNVEQTHYGSGDNVAGDKFVTENPATYKPLNDESTQKVFDNIESFKEKNEGLNILLQFFTTDDGTREFAYAFKELMAKHDIDVHVVPIQVVGLPPSKVGIQFKYNNISAETVPKFIQAILPIFSTKNGSIIIPPPTEAPDIAEGYNLLIQIAKQVYFDENGKAYFN